MAYYILTTTFRAETAHPRKSSPNPRAEIQAWLERTRNWHNF